MLTNTTGVTIDSGEATASQAISGVQPADTGECSWIDGQRVSIRNPQSAYKLGIATVYQDLALCDNLDVVANLFLGTETLTRGPGRAVRVLDEQAMEHRTLELLDALGVTTVASVRSVVGSLSGGQRQSVAITGASHPGLPGHGDEAVAALPAP